MTTPSSSSSKSIFQTILNNITNPTKVYRCICDTIDFTLGITSSIASLAVLVYNFREAGTTHDHTLLARVGAPLIVLPLAATLSILFSARRSVAYAYHISNPSNMEALIKNLHWVGSSIFYFTIPIQNYFMLWATLYDANGTVDEYDDYYTKGSLFIDWEHQNNPKNQLRAAHMNMANTLAKSRVVARKSNGTANGNSSKNNNVIDTTNDNDSNDSRNDEEEEMMMMINGGAKNPTTLYCYSLKLLDSSFNSAKKWIFNRVSFLKALDDAVYDEAFCYTPLTIQAFFHIPMLLLEIYIYSTSFTTVSSSSSPTTTFLFGRVNGKTLQETSICLGAMFLASRAFYFVSRSFNFSSYCAKSAFTAFDIFANVACLSVVCNTLHHQYTTTVVASSSSSASMPTTISIFTGMLYSFNDTSLPSPVRWYVIPRVVAITFFTGCGIVILVRGLLGARGGGRQTSSAYEEVVMMGVWIATALPPIVNSSGFTWLTIATQFVENMEFVNTEKRRGGATEVVKKYPLARFLHEFLFDNSSENGGTTKKEVIDWVATEKAVRDHLLRHSHRLGTKSDHEHQKSYLWQKASLVLNEFGMSEKIKDSPEITCKFSSIENLFNECATKSSSTNSMIQNGTVKDNFYNRCRFLMILRNLKQKYVSGTHIPQNSPNALDGTPLLPVTNEKNLSSPTSKIGFFDIFSIPSRQNISSMIESVASRTEITVFDAFIKIIAAANVFTMFNLLCWISSSSSLNSLSSSSSSSLILINNSTTFVKFILGSCGLLFGTSLLFLPATIKQHLTLSMYVNCCYGRSDITKMCEEFDLYYAVPRKESFPKIVNKKMKSGEEKVVAIPTDALVDHVLPFIPRGFIGGLGPLSSKEDLDEVWNEINE